MVHKSWDDFLDAYQTVKRQRDSYEALVLGLLAECADHLDVDMFKRYESSLERIQNGTDFSDSIIGH